MKNYFVSLGRVERRGFCVEFEAGKNSNGKKARNDQEIVYSIVSETATADGGIRARRGSD